MTEPDSQYPPDSEFDDLSVQPPMFADDSPESLEEATSPIEEDKAAEMSMEVRIFDGVANETTFDADPIPPAAAQALEPRSMAGGFSGGDALVPPSARFRKGEWQHEFSGHKIAIELAKVEADVRKILDERDPKRKRKLISTHRWQELEEDVIAMKFSGRMGEGDLRELTRLVMQRHFLFSQLRFVASTRSTWNT